MYRTALPRRATRDVRVGGALLDHVQSVDWSFDIATVPTATIRVRGAPPASVFFNAQVTIEAGFNSANLRQFTGEVQGVDRDGPDTVISCMGKAHALDVPYHKVVYTFTNVTDQQAITDFLNNAKVLQFQVNMPTPLWTIGTVVQPTITLQTWGEAIIKVAEVQGAAWFEYPSGVIIVQRVDPIPSFTAAKQYFTMVVAGLISTYPVGITQTLTVDGTSYPTLPHIRQIRLEQQIREVKNQIFVKGATIGIVQGDGTTTPFDVTATDFASSPWVVNPDGTQAYNDYIYPNELIDTVAQAGITAQRLLDVKNRLNYKGTLTLDFDPTAVLAQTVQIEDPSYAGASGNWFVTGYSTSMSESDAVTTLSVIGGGQSGGQGNLLPIPFFVWTIEREVIGDREWAVVTFNGLLSTDLDGSIASYSWSDNQALVSGTTAFITVRVDPATVTNPWNVTLTVTDDKGASAAQTLTISLLKTDKNVFVPGLFVAFGNYFSASPDGGITWNDKATVGGRSIEAVSAMPRGGLAGCAVFGCSDGTLWQTKDFCNTTPTKVASGLGSPVKHILSDGNNITHIYALTQNGQIWRSLTNGDNGTWVLYEDLRLKLSLPALRANRIALPVLGGVWVYGGTGTGLPLITFDAVTSHNWTIAALGGDLANDLNLSPFPNTAFNIASGYYVGDNASSRPFTGLGFQPDMVIIKRALTANGSGIFRTSNMPAGQSMSFISEATLTDGILSLDADGFTVGNNSETNAAGPAAYRWVAIKDAQGLGNNIKFGTYQGNGAASKAITDVGFTPAWVWTKSGATVGNGAAIQRQTEYTGTDSRTFAGTGTPVVGANGIISLDALGFTIGNRLDVNRNLEQFYYVAFRATTNFKTGSYTGDNTASHAIPTTGVVPDFVSVRGNDAAATSQPRWRAAGLGFPDANSSGYAASVIDVTDGIISLDAAGFTVGINDDVNTAATTYYWVALDAVLAVSGGAGPADLYIYEAGIDGVGFAFILDSATYQPSVYYTDDIFGDGSHWRRAVGLPAKTHGRYIQGDMVAGRFFLTYNDTALYKGDVTNGVMAVSLQGGVLQANDAPNHGVFLGYFIGGIAGVYLLAAEGTADGTIWKTFDRGVTINKLRPATGFPAVLGGMDAKAIAIADSANAQLDALLAQTGDLNDTTTASRLVASLGASWVSQGLVSSTATPTFLKRLGANLYRIIGNLQYGVSHAKPVFGGLQRSINNGAAWADVGPAYHAGGSSLKDWGCTAVCAGADGTLWGAWSALLSAVAGDQPKIYKSTDGGATWTFVYEYTTLSGGNYDHIVSISAHPTNKDVVVAVGSYNFGTFAIWVSTNATGAGTFTRRTPSSNSTAQGYREVLVMQSGRCITIGGTSGAYALKYTDDYGLTALVSATGLNTSVYVWHMIRGDNNVLFLGYGNTQNSYLARSKDGGATWVNILTLSQWGSGAPQFSGFISLLSMYYDSVQDKLYVGSQNNVGSKDSVLLIPNASTQPAPMNPALIFDITLNLQAVMGTAHEDHLGNWSLAR